MSKENRSSDTDPNIYSHIRKCNYCKKNFCTDHRSFTDHECSHKDNFDIVSIECLKCKKTLKMYKNEDEDIILNKHYEICSNIYDKKENICKKIGCKTKLVFSNTYNCKKCNLDVCMNHRFEEEHFCKSLLEKEDGLSQLSMNVLVKRMKL